MNRLFFVVLAALFCLSFERIEDLDSSAAVLSFEKRFIFTKWPVVGEEFSLIYQVTNLGETEALNVQIDDSYDFSENDFVVVSGTFKPSWGRIDPGETVSHAVRLVSPTAGHKPIDIAEIVYYTKGKDGYEEIHGFSTIGGYIKIKKSSDNEFIEIPNYEIWVAFSAVLVAILFLPFRKLSQIVEKYEKGIAKNKIKSKK